MSNSTQPDDAPITFSKTTNPCKICNRNISDEQDRPTHWLACSARKRREAKNQPSTYMHDRNMADTEFGKLKLDYHTSDVQESAHKFFWALQASEALGEVDYRRILESLDSTLATEDLDHEVLQLMLTRLNNTGNIHNVVMALEDSMEYSGESGLLVSGDRTTNVSLLQSWRKYEIEWMKAHLFDMRDFGEVYAEFERWERVRRDALPGRSRAAFAVWWYKLGQVGHGSL